MGGKSTRVLLWLVALASVGACSGGDKPPPLQQNPTAKEECTDVLTTLCQRAVGDCQIAAYGSTPQNCVDTSVPQCCQNSCSSIALSGQGDVDRCRNVLEDYSCDSLAQQVLPTECQHVVRYYR